MAETSNEKLAMEQDLTARLLGELDWSRAEIERLQARVAELEGYNVGLATESERLRAALEELVRIDDEAEDGGLKVAASAASDLVLVLLKARDALAGRLPHETAELSRALHTIDEAGKLSDWINRARPVITELMEAYARLVRSHSGMGAMELAEVQPWRCMEYIGAEQLLRDQPVAVVEIPAVNGSGAP